MGVALVRVGAPSVAGMVGCAGLTRSLPGTWLPSSDEFGKNLVDACDFGGDDGVCLPLR